MAMLSPCDAMQRGTQQHAHQRVQQVAIKSDFQVHLIVASSLQADRGIGLAFFGVVRLEPAGGDGFCLGPKLHRLFAAGVGVDCADRV